jgi:hypothetical protein
MAQARDGLMGDAEFDKISADPSKLNDPAAVARLAADGIVDGAPAEGEVPEAADEGQDAGGEDAAAEGVEAAGDESGTAGDEPPAPVQEDPAVKSVRLETENRIYREMLAAGIGGPKKEETPPPPPAKPTHVVEWEKLAAVDRQTARSHYEKLVADGNTFDADQFLAAWQNAPGHLAQYRDAEAFRASVVQERQTEQAVKAGSELKALAKSHPDWEKYADTMEDLAKRDAAAQKAGLPSAYSSMEELYQEAYRKKGGPTPVALSPEDARRKAALGRGPSSKRGGAAGVGSKADPEQELIRSILRNDVRI